MNTSGVVLFGKQPDVVAAMHDQFRDQAVSKQYLALCLGVPRQQEFSVDVGIGQHASLKWVPLTFIVEGEGERVGTSSCAVSAQTCAFCRS